MIFRSASGDIFAGRRHICSKASLNVARGVVDCQHHHPATHWVSENLIPFQNPVFKYWNKPAIANPQCLACSPNHLAEVSWGVWQCFDLSQAFSDFYRIWSLELPSDSRGKRLPGTTDWQPRLQKAEKYGQTSILQFCVQPHHSSVGESPWAENVDSLQILNRRSNLITLYHLLRQLLCFLVQLGNLKLTRVFENMPWRSK